jgi:hypothetical protein
MGRGGFRANAGRKADPNSARQRKLAAKAAKATKAEPGAGRAPAAKDRGLTAPDGRKKPEAGASWPFGTQPESPPESPPDAAGAGHGVFSSPLEFWEHVLKDPEASASAKHAAAYAMAPYVHAKIAPKGKKEAALENAKTKPSRFAQAAAPRLAAAGGKRVR